MLGRTFLPGEDGIPKPVDASQVVILSYGMWRENFGGDPNVIGRMVRLNQVPYAVVGVMGPDFRFLRRSQALWVPLTMNRSNRDYRFLTVVGRLSKPRATAIAEMSTLAQSLSDNLSQDQQILDHSGGRFSGLAGQDVLPGAPAAGGGRARPDSA